MKSSHLLLVLLIFVSGLYIIGFGIYTIAYTHLFVNGLLLIVSGLITFMVSVLILFEEIKSRNIYEKRRVKAY